VISGVHFPQKAWHSKKAFLAALPSTEMQWSGSDDNVQGVLRLLNRYPVPLRRGVETLGYVETDGGPLWVADNVVLGPDGRRPASSIAFVPNGSSLVDRVQYPEADPTTIRKIAAQVFPDLLALNEPAVVLPVLGWFFATPFKVRIMRLHRQFPILFVWGTQGSGKTKMIVMIFWPLFGLTETEPYSATETPFALLKIFSSTNSVPVFIDEFKPGDMPRDRLHTLQRYLRRIYGGEVEERGRADLTVSTYRLEAPVCVAGEARPDDPALADRLVSAMPNKNRLDEHPEHVEAFERLQAADLNLLAAPYIQWSLARDTDADFKAAGETTDRVLSTIPGGSDVSGRCRFNLQVVAFGIAMFEAYAQHLGVVIPRLDLTAAFSTSVSDLMDGHRGAKNPLDHFIETLSVLAYDGEITISHHYTIIDGLVCIHLSSCWDAYLIHRRQIGLADDGVNMKVMRRLIEENHQRDGYVKEIGKTVTMRDNHRPRTIAIDLAQAAEFLDIEGFPGQSRTHGGPRSVTSVR
jgi:hypothetical protein